MCHSHTFHWASGISHFTIKQPQPSTTNNYRSFSSKASFIGRIRKIIRHKRSAESYRIADGLNEGCNLIYQGSSVNYVKFSYASVQAVFAVGVTSMCGIMFGADMPTNLSQMTGIELGFGSIITIVWVTGALKFVKIYPLRIYFHEQTNKFTIVLMGKHPFCTRLIHVSPGDAKIKKSTYITRNILPWGNDICSLSNDQDLLVIQYNFSSPVYYNMLFGF